MLKNIIVAATLVTALAPAITNADIAISTDPTQNMNCANGVCTATKRSAVLNVTDLTTMLAAGDVTIAAYNGRKHVSGAIKIDTTLSWANSSKLTLSPNYRYDVDVNAPITVMGTGGLATSYSLVLAFNSSVTFWDLNSSLSINGVSFTLVGDVPTLAADIAAAQGKGSYALANDYDAVGDIFRKAPIPEFTGELTGLGHSIANLKITNGHNGCEGLIAENHGTVSNLRLRAVTVTSTKQKNVGAIAGCNYSQISNVSVDGSVSGNATANVGGIAGANLENIYVASAAIAVSGGQAGGIAGENDGSVYQAYATGSVTGQSNVGGLAGANRSDLQESYSTVAVNGNAGTVGGLAGFNGSADGGRIIDCYSTGTVTGTGVVGGLVGYDPDESVFNGYWDLDTSGISDPNQGAGFPKDDAAIVGLTTAQLQSRLPSGFSKKVWHLDPNINDGFPYLRAIPPH